MSRTEHLVSIVPVGCTCPWGQVHMDMPWQKLSTAADCPLHGPLREDLGGL